MQNPSSRPATAAEQADAILAQIPKQQTSSTPAPEPGDQAPVPGLAEADAALKAALDKRTSIKTRLARTEAAMALATKDRAALVARTAAGDVVPASESRANQDALSAIEVDLGLLRDALPGTEAEIKASEERGAKVLRSEAQRLELAAVEVNEAASRALTVAQRREQHAAEALAAARRRSASAGNRNLWNGRVPAAPTDGGEDDIFGPAGWDKFVSDQAAKTGRTGNRLKRRAALADAILANVNACLR